MKRPIILFASTVLIGTLLIGCAAMCTAMDHSPDNPAVCITKSLPDGKDIFINLEYSAEKMTTVEGKEISLLSPDVLSVSKNSGFAMLLPNSWKERVEQGLHIIAMDNSFSIQYFPEEAQAQLEAMGQNSDESDSISEDELSRLYQKVFSSAFPFASVYAVKEGIKSGDDFGVPGNEMYEVTDCIASVNEFVYYIAYNKTAPKDGFSDNDRLAIQGMINGVEALKNQLVLFPPFDEAANFAGTLSEFKAQDLIGNEVDQTVFSNYDLTMVNIWTTWCGFCVEEMPDLGQLHKQLPENVNLISICGDAAEETELAQRILRESGADFQTLIGNESLQESCLRYISSFPTTLFVDQTGHVVGNIQIAAPEGETIIDGYLTLIKEKLSILNQ